MPACLSHCSECPRKKDGSYLAEPVPADGPPDAKIMFIGEAPGPAEDRGRRPFIGPTGDEFNGQYLPLAGLNRRQVYVTNAVKCYPGKGRTPSEKVAESCFLRHTTEEIARIKPEVIVAMGGIAARRFFSDVDIETHHGFPVTLQFGKDLLANKPIGATLLPTYHPAAGLHDTSLITDLRDDFEALGLLLKGTLVTPQDEYPNPDYDNCPQGIYAPIPGRPLAIDTEYDSKTGEPWCLTWSCQPGTGYLVEAEDKEACEAFNLALQDAPKIIFHNALADIPVLAKMGIDIPIRKVDDTMMRSFHLAKYPQSLKRLAFRLAGMEMQEFEDVVGPYARADAETYLEAATYETWERPEPEARYTEEKGWHIYKPQSMNTKLKRLFTDLRKNPGLDPRKRWENWSERERFMLEDVLGPMPPMSIASVPFDKALNYACRDADATLRVYHKLMGLKHIRRRRAA